MIVRQFKAASIDVKCTMFRAYCYTIYGMSLWARYKAATLDRLRVNYNNIARRLANVPPWNSASEMFVGLRLKGFHELRRSSCYSLKTRVQQCSNSLVRHVVNSDARWHSPLWQKWEWLLSVPLRG